MLTRMQQRRGTQAEWSDAVISSTVVLSAGEVGLETDTGRFKIGNGTTVWSNLPYYLPDTNPTNSASRAGKNNHDLYVKLAPIAPGYSQTITGINVLVPQANTQTPLTVAGLSGQTALLQSWRSNLSVTTPVASISNAGKLTAHGASFTDNVQINNNVITGIKDADSSFTDDYAVNKKYVDEAIAGLTWKAAINLAATVNVSLTGLTNTLVLDGHSALTQAHGNGYRILLLNQTDPAENGIYDYSDNGTNYTLARSSDANTLAELEGASVFIQEGDVYGTSSWVQTDHYLTNFADQEWIQFNGASQITAGTGLTKNGNVIDAIGTADRITVNADSIDIASTYVGQTSITTVGNISTGTWTADTIAADQGGTGQSSYTKGDILYASSTSALAKLPAGTIHYPLVSGGTGADPLYEQIVTAGIADSTSTTTGVTYAKIQHISATNRVLGRIASGSGVVEELNGDNVVTIINTASSGKIDTTRLNTATGGNYGTSTDVARKDHTHNIDDLADVIITGTPQTRQVIKFNGINWINELPSGGISTGPTPPDQPSNGDAWFDTTDGSLYVRYDDAVGSGTRTNLVTNPSFETNLTGWNYSGGTFTRASDKSYVGSYSAKLNSIVATQSIISGYIAISPSTTYTMSAWVNITAGATVYATLRFSPGQSLAGAAGTNLTLTGTGGWQRISITGNAGSTMNYASIIFQSSTVPVDIYLDAVMLEASATMNDYIEGTVVSGSTAQWVQVKANSALEASILTRMSAVEARNTKIEAANAVRVANQAERDSVYPAPVQGNTVFRADLGYEEKYYAAYNATTNPDGTTGTIGWYRYAGSAPLSSNYIINGAFDVWQRGNNFSGPNNTYTADRWLAGFTEGSFSVGRIGDVPSGVGVRNAITLNGSSTTAPRIKQRIESNNAQFFAGKTVTLSFYAKSISGTGTDNLKVNTRTITLNADKDLFGLSILDKSALSVSPSGPPSDSWTRYFVTFQVPTSSANGYEIEIYRDSTLSSSTTFITGVQLEEGPVPTPFRSNQPNIQAELAACQRYYYRNAATATGGQLGHGWGTGTTSAVISVELKTSMRIPPTSIDYASVALGNNIDGGLGAVTAVSLTAVQTTPNNAVVSVTASSLAMRNTYWLQSSNASGYVGFSAEL